MRISSITARTVSQVKVDDEARLWVNGFDRVLEVLELLPKRAGTPEAMKAYQDITPPRLTDPATGTVIFRPRSTGRPTKREYRQLDALRSRIVY